MSIFGAAAASSFTVNGNGTISAIAPGGSIGNGGRDRQHCGGYERDEQR